jgi:hypothetical protein
LREYSETEGPADLSHRRGCKQRER